MDRGGILNFAHDFLRTAVETAFAPDEEASRPAPAARRLLRGATHHGAHLRRTALAPEGTDSRDRLRACLLDIDRFLLI